MGVYFVGVWLLRLRLMICWFSDVILDYSDWMCYNCDVLICCVCYNDWVNDWLVFCKLRIYALYFCCYIFYDNNLD